MVSDAIKPAIRKAMRLHEIGTDTPYRISFAAKGKSGGSFGYMQGDLAAGQPMVTATFRNVMTAAGMSAGETNTLIALLSKHQIKNPLSAPDTARVNLALQSSSGLVDQMDETILQDVFRDLDICLSHATAKHRTIDAKALVYMALWINMSGPPSKILTWLDGGDPHLARIVAPAANVVRGDAMEDYLAATNYYVENPQNLQHLHECAAAGMRELDSATATLAFSADVSAATNLFAANVPAAHPASSAAAVSVTISVKASNGTDYTVSIEKTGTDTGSLSLQKASDASANSYSVTGIKARTDGSKLVCHATIGATIACSLRTGRDSNSDGIEIAITDTFFGMGNQVATYAAKHPDFERLKSFIAASGFPALDPAPATQSAATPPEADEVAMASSLTTAQSTSISSAPVAEVDVYDAASSALEIWRLQKSASDYDAGVDALVRDAATRVKNSPSETEIAKWLNVQSSARGIADPEISGTTLALRNVAPQEFEGAMLSISAANRVRIGLELGDVGVGDDTADAAGSHAHPMVPAAALAGGSMCPLGAFIGQSIFTSVRGYPVVRGIMTLTDRNGMTLGSYHVNSGGGAPNFRTTNGPIPPGIYRISGFRARATVGMVLHDVGYSFDLDPVLNTPVFGRSLFRLHPDGGSEQTNGCLGVREEAPNLRACRDHLIQLIAAGSAYVSVAYTGLKI